VIRDARFPAVAAGAGHYESYFVKAHHPDEPKAFWLRHTVHQRPGEPQTASLWLTLFDAGAPAGATVVAGKQTFAGAAVPEDGYIAIGDAILGRRGGRGSLASPTLDADWDFAIRGAEPEQRHLPAAWMYGAPVPRTKSGTPHPGAHFSGRVGPFDLSGWRGLVSHNWGSQHAERWIWLHSALTGGWLELVCGRLKAGRWTTPWLADGALQLDGARHRLGGPRTVRATKVDEEPTGARFVVTGDGLRVEGEVRAPAERFVTWRYADPDGPEHHSAHTSLADLRLQVRRPAGANLELMLPMGASYELGMRETDHGLEVQPYADGRL